LADAEKIASRQQKVAALFNSQLARDGLRESLGAKCARDVERLAAALAGGAAAKGAFQLLQRLFRKAVSPP
jgi:DNA mismatch repair ATPase MutS